VLEDVAGVEVLEVGVGAAQVRQGSVASGGIVRGQGERHGHVGGRDLTGRERGVDVPLPDLDLALEGQHHLAVLVAARGLHVHDALVALARRALHAEHGRLRLERVAHAHRHAETHVDVLEVGACVLGDVLDALTEDDRHHHARLDDEPSEAVRLRVADVLREGVRRHREVGEDREQPLGDRLAALVPVGVARAEVLEEVPVLLADDRHGSVP
jgi:hypothetical protein